MVDLVVVVGFVVCFFVYYFFGFDILIDDMVVGLYDGVE